MAIAKHYGFRRHSVFSTEGSFGLLVTLTLQSNPFFFPCFLRFPIFLAVLCAFSFLFQGFEGFREEKNPCFFRGFPCLFPKKQGLEGQGIAESLARMIAAVRITSARWRSYLPPPTTEISPHGACIRCAAARIARLAFIRATCVPCRTAKWPARVDRVR